ncbi:hypothetical protein Dimus_020152 [Dionaea muscipula]
MARNTRKQMETHWQTRKGRQATAVKKMSYPCFIQEVTMDGGNLYSDSDNDDQLVASAFNGNETERLNIGSKANDKKVEELEMNLSSTIYNSFQAEHWITR